MAKTHVSPLNQRTIPQPELKEACVGFDLAILITTELYLENTKTFPIPTRRPYFNGSTRKSASLMSLPATVLEKSIEKLIRRSGDT